MVWSVRGDLVLDPLLVVLGVARGFSGYVTSVMRMRRIRVGRWNGFAPCDCWGAFWTRRRRGEEDLSEATRSEPEGPAQQVPACSKPKGKNQKNRLVCRFDPVKVPETIQPAGFLRYNRWQIFRSPNRYL
ncbi:hypothetical protein B0H13DRAFT_1889910 [Mycena leptocephala]|nr:hypothetical protein B0H13DRAFT_1889910 [Mycena leptocephala]